MKTINVFAHNYCALPQLRNTPSTANADKILVTINSLQDLGDLLSELEMRVKDNEHDL
ncbi:MAG: hypothetical protein WDN75_19310 [Bacteroidota bacterium]